MAPRTTRGHHGSGDQGLTVRTADLVTEPVVPDSVTAVAAVTAECPTLNVADDLPAGTVTVAGVEAASAFELLRETTSPPAGATPERVTVPVTAVEELPFTEDGETVSEAIETGSTVSVACAEEEPTAAVSVAVESDAAAEVLTEKEPLALPTGTTSVAGNVTAFELDFNFTETAPP